MVRRFEAQTVGEKPIAEGIAKAIASSVKTQTFILVWGLPERQDTWESILIDIKREKKEEELWNTLQELKA